MHILWDGIWTLQKNKFTFAKDRRFKHVLFYHHRNGRSQRLKKVPNRYYLAASSNKKIGRSIKKSKNVKIDRKI